MRKPALANFRGLLLGAAAFVCGCDKPHDVATSAASVAIPAPPAPPAAAVQAIYDRSCKTCHAIPGSGAPQTGDIKAWAPRIASGAQVLLDHTFNGYKGMPPMGACMDCNEGQYRALIEYMSGAQLDKK
jgi:cytochrome c5